MLTSALSSETEAPDPLNDQEGMHDQEDDESVYDFDQAGYDLARHFENHPYGFFIYFL